MDRRRKIESSFSLPRSKKSCSKEEEKNMYCYNKRRINGWTKKNNIALK
jgi:hypothetical protein